MKPREAMAAQTAKIFGQYCQIDKKEELIMKILLPVLLLGVWLAWAIPAAANVTIGLPADPNTGNWYPFGCAYSTLGTGEYQQVYTKSLFSGPITITNLEFFNTQFNSGATAMNSGNWAISLSTTSRDWNTLSTTFSSNIGANNTLVFSGDPSQPWTFGNTLVINLSTPFTYDPSQGNLLMDVVATNTSQIGGSIFFDTNGVNNNGFNGNTIMGRVYSDAGGIAVNSGYGLVTEFSTGATAVPEPISLLFLGAGLVGMAVIKRKNRKEEK
jgi:hypothetical protein